METKQHKFSFKDLQNTKLIVGLLIVLLGCSAFLLQIKPANSTALIETGKDVLDIKKDVDNGKSIPEAVGGHTGDIIEDVALTINPVAQGAKALNNLGGVAAGAAGAADTLTHGAFSDAIGDAVSSLADEMLEGLGNDISSGAVSFGSQLVTTLVKDCGPNMNLFYYALDGGDLTTSGRSSGYGKKRVEHIQNIAQMFGFGIATIILLFSILGYFWADPSSIKETPVRLVFRYTIAMFLIWFQNDIINEVIEIGNNVWDNYIMTSMIEGKHSGVSFYRFLGVKNLKELLDVKNLQILGIPVGKTVFATMLPLIVWVPILAIIIYWPLIKGFFKFYIEIIERYIVVILLYLFFGAAAATITSKNSSNIFKSYMRMMACQILLLFVNVVFMDAFIEVLIGGGWTRSIPNYIFALAYLRMTQKIDSYMASLGLNVAQTGGQTLDTLGGVALGALGSLRAMNDLRKGGQKIAANYAMGQGNFKAAALLNGTTGVREFSDMVGKGGTANAGLDMAASNGRKMPVSAKESADKIKDMVNSPANNTYRNRVGAMDETSQLQGINKILSESGQRIKATGVDESKLRAGQLNFTAKPIDENGNIIKNAPEVKGTLSANAIDGSVKLNGQGNMNLSTQNALKDTPGEQVEGNATALGYLSGTSKVLNKADKNYKNKIASMSYDAENGGKFNIFDSKNRQIGTIANINGKQTLVQGMGEGTTGSKKSFENCMNNENTISQLEKDNNFKKGSLKWNLSDAHPTGMIEGTATQVDDFGNEKQVKVRARDVGMTGDASGNISKLNTSNLGEGWSGTAAVGVKTKAIPSVDTAASRKPTTAIPSDRGTTTTPQGKDLDAAMNPAPQNTRPKGPVYNEDAQLKDLQNESKKTRPKNNRANRFEPR